MKREEQEAAYNEEKGKTKLKEEAERKADILQRVEDKAYGVHI